MKSNANNYIQSLPRKSSNPWVIYEQAKRWYAKHGGLSPSEYNEFIRKVTARLGI